MGATRAGWRWAGIEAEMQYLVRERFTGRVEYWFEAGELRRNLVATWTPNRAGRDAEGAEARLAEVRPEIEGWLRAGESKLTAFFSRGRLSKLEF